MYDLCFSLTLSHSLTLFDSLLPSPASARQEPRESIPFRGLLAPLLHFHTVRVRRISKPNHQRRQERPEDHIVEGRDPLAARHPIVAVLQHATVRWSPIAPRREVVRGRCAHRWAHPGGAGSVRDIVPLRVGVGVRSVQAPLVRARQVLVHRRALANLVDLKDAQDNICGKQHGEDQQCLEEDPQVLDAARPVLDLDQRQRRDGQYY